MKENVKHRNSLALQAARWYAEEDNNCAEALLRGCNERYTLGITDDDMRLASGLGGGVQIKDICGALTGAVLACGKLFIKERAHESEILKVIVPKFLERFKQEYGSIECSQLREMYHSDQYGCLKTVELASEVFEQIVTEHECEIIE
jgi:C_GCAxxG_C_C family probable redox protein